MIAVDAPSLPNARRGLAAASDPPPAAAVLAVSPWGDFTPALNALAAAAGPANASGPASSYILYVSAETTFAPSALLSLLAACGADTLVVGAALPGHLFEPAPDGEPRPRPLTGRTVPWNTLALWSLPKLLLTGFLLVSDECHPGVGKAAGVEEAACAAALQRLLPAGEARCKLLGGLEGVAWERGFESDERREWHERKMRSKEERAGRQLELLGAGGGEQIRALAAYEKEPDAVNTDLPMLLRDGHPPPSSPAPYPAFYCLAVRAGGAVVGYCTWFVAFSTWEGRVLYLEDLYVAPEHRGGGVGRSVMKALARTARALDCGRFVWQALDWNKPAIEFYEKIGANIITEWVDCRMGREEIAAFADS
ncbi:hypothetical protein TeGR_g5377 [Tetraparma gracilis]|uniref:N-acetyltransferase domain-containing protein n=1 Tax=Tetraparma gracilis TaxID=2962635 RepID=A0ABQ6MI06_9STRA|nr:hypothetical protein TeGR_g5377 [Tetraparma gracilis]